MTHRPSRLAIWISNALRIATLLLIVLWVQSLIRGATITRRTTVISGDVIQATDPNEKLTEYISHTRWISPHIGRVYLGSMRAEELNKSQGLPRRISYLFNWSWGRTHDRFTAPEWAARLGFDWSFGDVREGGRPNGEYWSNRDVFVCMPYWALVLVTGTGGWLIGRRSRIVRRRLKRGLCVACGYDTRATPQRCPECGDEPAPAEAVHEC